jgi:hypothetical protein
VSCCTIVAAKRRTPVYLEVGHKRTFACAVDWPGWSRSGSNEVTAIETLAAYAPRYAKAASRAGVRVPAITAADLDIVERLTGNATTDFGAPSLVAAVDKARLDAAAASRVVALLIAAWDELDAVVAAAPATLRKGPRGGGRDRDAIYEHVAEAERSYARKIGIGLTATSWRDGHVALLRERIADTLRRARGGNAPGEHGWPPRYMARRMAWHALDHAWEIEDRSA